MSGKNTNILFLIFLSYFLWGCHPSSKDLALSQLDYEITRKKLYDAEKEEKIDQLKRLLQQSTDQDVIRELNWQLIKEYRTFKADSSEVYSLRLIDLGDEMGSETTRNLGLIGLMDSYNSIGYFKEAKDIMDVIDTDAIPDEVKPIYLSTVYRLYQSLESLIVESDSKLKNEYKEKRTDLLRAIIESTDSSSYEHSAAVLDLLEITGKNNDETVKRRLELLEKFNPNQIEKSYQYQKISDEFIEKGKINEAVEFLAKAGVADIKNSTKNAASLDKLAQLSLASGDEKRGATYIMEGLEDADYFGSLIRKVELKSMLPSGYRTPKGERGKNAIMAIFISLTVICVFLLVWLYIYYKKESERIKDTLKQLAKADKLLFFKNKQIEAFQKEKEELESQLKEVTGLKDYFILQALQNNSGTKEERQNFFKAFDKGFLHMFPNFIDEINRLLPSQEKIKIGEDGELPVDVRIFALIRLGITEPAEIARYLNLSVKTVYVYKTRMKSKAKIDNNEFENHIMAIPRP